MFRKYIILFYLNAVFWSVMKYWHGSISWKASWNPLISAVFHHKNTYSYIVIFYFCILSEPTMYHFRTKWCYVNKFSDINIYIFIYYWLWLYTYLFIYYLHICISNFQSCFYSSFFISIIFINISKKKL